MQKVTIEINRANCSKSQLRPERKNRGGLVRTRRENDYQARRQRVGSQIQFFDFGQRKSSGIWVDRNLKNTTAPTFPSDVFTPYLLTDADWLPIQNACLAVTDFQNEARLIEKTHNRLFDLVITLTDGVDFFEQIHLGTDARFTADHKLNLSNADLAAPVILLYNSLDEVQLVLKDNLGIYSGVNKFTLENSPSADAVIFSLQRTDKIYLVPYFWQARAQALRSTISPLASYTYFLNFFHTIKPRRFFLDSSNPFYDYALDVNFETGDGAGIYADLFESFAIQKSYAETRGYYQIINSTDNTEEHGVYDPAEFPPDFLPLPPSSPTEGAAFSGFQTENAPAGFLQAVVLRGNQKIYCWKISGH